MIQEQLYHRIKSLSGHSQNKVLEANYLALRDTSKVAKTHYFGGRFENIYIEREDIPNVSELLQEAIKHASQILDCNKKIKAGFWFNEMQAGHTTTAHTHDEDDELLSGVYYINVPENSGDLVLGDEVITPREGEFIFFAPTLLHAVNENKSGHMRLSMGMNFGLA